MGFTGFTRADFQVFDIPDFQGRMAAIRSRIRPQLEGLGAALLSDVARLIGDDAFAHVAKHARRTVNPPNDTWVAFASDKRGYKKHPHFKVAVSRNCVRFLFEAGPEYADKKRFVAAWKRQGAKIVPSLRKTKGLAWFKNEHDEEPAAILSDLSADEVIKLGDELVRTRDGQFVVGRLVSQAEAIKWGGEEYRKAALTTFETLAPLYRLH
jgi:uncharacterized protein YktB (UPF0637 family)